MQGQGICSIFGTVAPESLTIAFSSSEKETNEFEVQPLVLKHMQDHVNIGIRFMRRIKMQIKYDEALDEIWSPFLGQIFGGESCICCFEDRAFRLDEILGC